MIQRVILTNPERAKDFDHFNDYTNTWNWLMGLPQTKQRNHAIKALMKSKESYDKKIPYINPRTKDLQ